MKRNLATKVIIYSLVGVMQIGLGASVLEASPHDNGQRYEQKNDRNDQKRDAMPFKWHERRGNFSPDQHRMDRIDDHQFADRFPGMHPYRWHDKRGEGFTYHGRRITNAVFFYNDSDELVSIGFMYDGAFIRINADRGEDRSSDSFFPSWMNRH